jgi:multiple sugar transport system ATP-binding protein
VQSVPAIVLDRVTKVYDGDVRAVDQVSLEVADGELLVLLGPSGCGKTTLLRMIAGLEDITSGELWLEGQRATELEPGDRNVAMVFQHSALYPHLTVRENLAFPLLTGGGISRPAADARVREIAYGLGLDDHLDRKPGTLSGGERQRVAMGRALILRGPTILLMDEPLASLDVGQRTGLRSEIGAIIRAMRLTTVYVTHDQAEALSLADRVAILRDGVIEDHGPPRRVYTDPATAFAAAFLGSPQINLTRAAVEVREGDRVVLDFTAQRIDLPWSDPRRPDLARYDGQDVVVGIRPEALTPVQAGTAVPPGRAGLQASFRGRVSALEYYGHEWLARVDAGLRLVDLDEVRGRPGPAELTAAGAGPADGSPANGSAARRPAADRPPAPGGASDGADPDGEPDGAGELATAGRRLGRLRRRGKPVGPPVTAAADDPSSPDDPTAPAHHSAGHHSAGHYPPGQDDAGLDGVGQAGVGHDNTGHDSTGHDDGGQSRSGRRDGGPGSRGDGARPGGARPGTRPASREGTPRESGRGGHRGASLLVRLDDPRDWSVGTEVSVVADTSRILIFDSCGRRIAPPRPPAP